MKLRVLTPVIAGLLGSQLAFAAPASTSDVAVTSVAVDQAATVSSAPVSTVAAPAAAAPAITAAATPAKPHTATVAAPTSLQGQISYTIGVDMGQNLKGQSIDVDPDMLAQGIRDSMSGSALLMSKDQMDNALKQFQQKLAAQQQQQQKEQGAQNAKDGAAFLASNKKQAGVTTLANGLQYKVIQAGTGASPTDADTVTVDYEGAFINGQVFSSTYKQGQPVTFQVTQVIPGWQQALKMMKPGAEWMLYIPSNLAYGTQGVGDSIGPNQTLVFKIHLISIQAPATTNSTAAAAPSA